MLNAFYCRVVPNTQTVFSDWNKKYELHVKNAITTNSISAGGRISIFQRLHKSIENARHKDVFELLGRLALFGN